MENHALIEKFYQSFQRMDAEGMAAQYHPEVEFTDPVFGTLKGAEVGAMWRMLTRRAKDLKIDYSAVSADAARGKAHWEARYRFKSPFGFRNNVHNVIEAEFEFKDGKIFRHRDHFDFPRWASMALWPLGGILGRSESFKARMQAGVRTKLEAFMRTGVVK